MNKTSGGDEILAELFQILKYDAVKVLHSICQQIWKTQQWSQRMFNLLHNSTHLTRQQSNAQNSPRQASAVHEL